MPEVSHCDLRHPYLRSDISQRIVTVPSCQDYFISITSSPNTTGVVRDHQGHGAPNSNETKVDDARLSVYLSSKMPQEIS
jgi:hypothetical protein